MKATENLYVDCLATVKPELTGQDALDQVAELEELVSRQWSEIAKLSTKVKSGRVDMHQKSTSDVKNDFACEKNTWRLVGKLYHHRLSPDSMDEDDNVPPGLARISEKVLIQKLFSRDRLLSEGQLVVDWLEMNARDNVDEVARLEYFTEGSMPWENTLAVLNAKGTNYRRPIVSSLDPDAPRREGKPLHDEDAQDLNQLLKTMFACIRAGLLETAQDICIRMGQSWRAAALEGWKLFHDPNYETGNQGVDEKLVSEGNKNRDIWKKVVWKMIKDDKLSLYERAIFAPYCGNVNFLIRMSTDWEDWLWAFTKCMVDMKVEKEIRDIMPRTFAPLPAEYWSSNKSSFNEIFDAIAASDNNVIKDQSNSPFQVVQRYLITGELNDLLDILDNWTSGDEGQESKVDDPHLLRFLAHLVIMLRRIVPEEVNYDKGHQVIRQYVLYLISTNRAQQVAWYVSQLPIESQIELYAAFLETVDADADRRLVITLGVESLLPMKVIKSRVVENVFAMETMLNPQGEEDMDFLISRKVDAIGWLLYDKDQRDEAMFQANALTRTLIATDKFSAALEACSKVPEDSIAIIASECKNEDQELDTKQSNTISEFLCWQLYFKAKEAFSDWFDHFHKAKPQEPMLPDNPNFKERVSYEQKEKQYQIDLERWQSTQEMQSREAQDKIMATLTFSGGWLVDQHGGRTEDQRSQEIDYLRRICLPGLVLLLHSVLHNTKQFEKAIQISDLVASEQHNLYEVYAQDKMRELLSKIRESSLEAMASGKLDSWGHIINS